MRITLEEAFWRVQKTITFHIGAMWAHAQVQAPRAVQNPHLPHLFWYGQGPRDPRVFYRRTHLSNMFGHGQIIKNPCKSCGGQGRTEKDRALSVNIPCGC
jgi:molecular chaperone DnaJ